MKKTAKIPYILSIAMLLIMGMVVYGCESEEQEEVDKQITTIERYLSSAQYEGYVKQSGVYIFATKSTDPNHDTDKVAIKGDSVMFWFEAYTFINASKGAVPFFTNKEAVMNTIQGVNTDFWPKEMVEVRIGGGGDRVTKGLGRGLVNCREGDKLEIFVTSDLAFGENAMQTIPKHTPIMYVVNVERVVKKES